MQTTLLSCIAAASRHAVACSQSTITPRVQTVAVIIASGVAGALRSWLFQSAAERVMFRLRTRLFAALLQQEVGRFAHIPCVLCAAALGKVGMSAGTAGQLPACGTGTARQDAAALLGIAAHRSASCPACQHVWTARQVQRLAGCAVALRPARLGPLVLACKELARLPGAHAYRLLFSCPLPPPQMGFFDRVRTGELLNRLAEDTRLLKTVATTSIAQALRAVAVCTLGLVMM
jgi:ABC-type multidrug transport system fused ATPase/permease subunit